MWPTADARHFFFLLIRNSHKTRGEEFDLSSASKQISLRNNTLHLTPAMMETKGNVNFFFQGYLEGRETTTVYLKGVIVTVFNNGKP